MLPEEQELILRIRRLQTDWQVHVCQLLFCPSSDLDKFASFSKASCVSN